jgi:hypothetical protein
MFVYYTYRERHISGGEALSNERWSDRADAFYDWTLGDLSVERPEDTPYQRSVTVGSFVDGKWVEGELKAREEAWAIVVKYSTGDTFGSSFGHGTVACVCTDGESAAKAVEIIKGGGTVDDKTYADWIGYFERLEGVHTERKIVFS